MLDLNKNYNINCLDGIDQLDDDSIGLMFTSPPYNVGVKYDIYDDKLDRGDYYRFMEKWFKKLYRVMRSGGRIAINVPFEVNMKNRGGRTFILGDYYNMMIKSGFKYNTVIMLQESAPHRLKYTAFGSWLSASAPYVYSPMECVLVGYKEVWKKPYRGNSYFTPSPEHKREFIDLVSGSWDYRAETKGLTKANFSMDLPRKAIKIFTYDNDIVLDTFSGSGTTLCAAKELGRKYIGFELSKNYYDIANKRLEVTEYA